MKVIEIPAEFWPRKAYVLDENDSHLLEFTPGIEVLPAQYHDAEAGGKFYFIKEHLAGEKGWPEGGYSCRGSNGESRSFYKDSLIIHPKYFKRKVRAEKIRKGEITGKRGRPKMDPSLLKKVEIYVPTGGRKGRPRKDLNSLQQPKVYVPTGGKRGRPSKVK